RSRRERARSPRLRRSPASAAHHQTTLRRRVGPSREDRSAAGRPGSNHSEPGQGAASRQSSRAIAHSAARPRGGHSEPADLFRVVIWLLSLRLGGADHPDRWAVPLYPRAEGGVVRPRDRSTRAAESRGAPTGDADDVSEWVEELYAARDTAANRAGE